MKLYLWSALCAFGISFVLCLLFIPVLRKMKAGQNILSYVKEHKGKSGTPTMGGLAFVLAASLAALLFSPVRNRRFIAVLAIGLAYLFVGLLDDLLKKKHKENLGLKAYQKFGFQFLVALFAGWLAYRSGATVLFVPFTSVSWNIGVWIFPLTVFCFLATVNAVNLTDGLDGLAAGSCVPFFTGLGVLCALRSRDIPSATVCFCLVGALLAYLVFNVPKASVFMGDTGSLSLGGFAAAIASFTGNALYILVIGAVFVFTVISVVLQVIYYKATGGKRIFLMSPAHHHFQQKGYSESKIAYAYSVITLLLAVICIVTAL